MSDGPFGRSSLGLLQRLRPEPVEVDDLRDAVDAVLPDLVTAQLQLSVVDSAADGPVVVLEEDEHYLRVHLADLAADMTDAGVRATPEAIEAALVAVGRGARVIEKHFTLNKGLPGPDHICSATPDELSDLCRYARLMEKVVK